MTERYKGTRVKRVEIERQNTERDRGVIVTEKRESQRS